MLIVAQKWMCVNRCWGPYFRKTGNTKLKNSAVGLPSGIVILANHHFLSTKAPSYANQPISSFAHRPDHPARQHRLGVERNSRNYLAMLADLGATPVLLSPDEAAKVPSCLIFHPDAQGRLPEAVLDHLDGLILSGGGDVHPRYFGAALAGADPESISEARDELATAPGPASPGPEPASFWYLPGLPGVECGCGRRDGAGLPQPPLVHRNLFCTTLPCWKAVAYSWIVGSTSLAVNTYHHQGVDHTTLAPGMRVAAQATAPDDWLVEAFESPTHRWVVGVQWHPERIFELPDAHRQIWESFMDACRERRQTTDG